MKYGCIRDTKDRNDLPMMLSYPGIFPPAIDLREWMPPVMNQGAIGSCTAHGVTAAARWHIIRQGTTYDFPMSRLQLYFDSRASESNTASDSGAQIRDVIKVLSQTGVGHEDLWPYDINKWAQKPVQEVYDDATQYKALSYQRVPTTVTALKTALLSNHPVVIGVSVYESFEGLAVEHDGIVPMPRDGEQMMGGHCMLVCGYGQKPGTFTVRNSWGEDWGDNGDCYMPEEYLGSNLGSDYWVIQLFGSGYEQKAAA